MVPTDEARTKIDFWIAVAPDNRVVETSRAEGRCVTQALEDGEIRFEETEFGLDDPELTLLADWCEREARKVPPRPPVKTSGAPLVERAEQAEQARTRKR